jgi:hypothetical protein
MKSLIIAAVALVSVSALAADVCILRASSQSAQDFIQIDCTHKAYKTITPKEDRNMAKAKVIKHFLDQGFELKTENVLVRQ